MKTLLLYCLMVLTCSGHLLKAQTNLRFQHFGKEEGMSQASAHCMFEDSRGYLWIGTDDGLNRFNGSSFTSFLPDHPDSSLAGAHVSDIIEDLSGNMWMGTNAGLSMYNPKNHEFTNFRWNSDKQDIIPTNSITSLLLDSQFVWIGTNFGLGRIHTSDFSTKIWRNDTVHQDSILRGNINSMLRLEDKLYMSTSIGVSIMDIESEQFTNPSMGAFNGETNEADVTDMVVDSKGTFWISTIDNGLAKLTTDWDNPMFETYLPGSPGGPAHRLVNDITIDASGQLLLATYEGLTIVNTSDSIYSQHFRYDGSGTSLQHNQCYEVYIDAQQRIWVGTGSGISLSDPYFNQFRSIEHIPNDPNSLVDNMVYAIEEDTYGNIWIGTFNKGLTIIDPEGGYHHISVEEGLSTSQVIAIEEQSPGKMWVGTFNGINEITWTKESGIQSIRRLPDGAANDGHVPSPYIYDLQWDGEYMWAASYGAGLFYIDPVNQSGGFVTGAEPDVATKRNIGYRLHLADNRLWVGYQKGGFGFVSKATDSLSFTDLSASLPGYNSMSIMGIYADSELWLGTDQGLVHFHSLDSLIEGNTAAPGIYARSTGAFSNTIYDIIPEDSDESLWISTTEGIVRWNRAQNNGKLYNQSIGIKNNEFNMGASARGRHGLIYMGSVDGVVIFDPESIAFNDDAPKIRLKELQLFNTSVDVGQSLGGKTFLEKDIDFVESLTLGYSQQVFSLVFEAIHFRLPETTTYAYKLVGLHSDWINTRFPLATFTNLNPGDYQLFYKASNNDGLWSPVRSIGITILPPWWRTWWAYLLYFMLFVVLIWLFIHLRIRSVRKMERIKRQEREAFRKRSRQDFHDEAGNKLTRIALITQVARQNAKDSEQGKLLDEIDENIKELESGMRDFIWVLNPEEDNLYDTMQRVRQFARSMYEYSNTRFSMDEPPASWKEIDLNMERRRNLMMIFKEAINNSVKYAQALNAKIKFDSTTDDLQLIFVDDGIGFEIDTLSRRGGLDNMLKRAHRIDVKLVIQSEKNKGTQIRIIL